VSESLFHIQPRELAPEAFREALARYPNDAEGALIFFAYAIGLGVETPTESDIAWAKEEIARRDRETFANAAER
jgi:hypothetical protein